MGGDAQAAIDSLLVVVDDGVGTFLARRIDAARAQFTSEVWRVPPVDRGGHGCAQHRPMVEQADPVDSGEHGTEPIGETP